MKYERILAYVSETPWAILPAKLGEILSVLAYRSTGHAFTPDEIRARIGEPSSSGSLSKRTGGVAVIPIRGVIAHRMGSMDDSSGGTSCERIASMLRQCVADDSIGHIILDVDSPGGTVTGMSELSAEVFAARQRKHITAIANGMMCSAAYDIGSQAHEVISIPSGLVGSIGVFSAHQDLSKALEQEGITVTLVSYGKFKTENNPYEALTAEGRAQIQRKVDRAGDQFVADVARGRNVSVSTVTNGFGQGRALGAAEARSAGLIDGIDTLDTLVANILSGRSITSGTAVYATLPDHGVSDYQARRLGEASDDDVERTRRRRLL